jgi:predicted outer membrane repeat protein
LWPYDSDVCFTENTADFAGGAMYIANRLSNQVTFSR